MFVYVGTYTEAPMGNGEGIYVFQFDPAMGSLSPVQTVTGIVNPSYLTTSADGAFLYAVSELDDGGVVSFSRNAATGELTRLNSQKTHGAHPCFIRFVATGQFVMVPNYNGENVAIFPIAADGQLEPASSVVTHHGSSINPDRQGEPHPHMISATPDGTYILVTDLGTDEIVVYTLDSEGKLARAEGVPSSIRTDPGAGPRHFAFSPNGRQLYVINELSSTIATFSHMDGHILPLQSISTLPAEFDGVSTCAQIVVSPDGRFVYGSNRGHDSITIFAIDSGSGQLTFVDCQSTLGNEPRNFTIDPSGTWLLVGNQFSNTVATFRRDSETGRLTPAGELTAVPTPVAIHFA